jgi:hypothetical protein
VTVDLLLPPPHIVERGQPEAHQVEHVGDHHRPVEAVGGGLEPREQIARHDSRVGSMFGQQRRRRALVAAGHAPGDQSGVQAYQRGQELAPAGQQPAGGHHRLVDSHPPRTARRHPRGGVTDGTHHRGPADPEALADRVDRDVLTRHRHRGACRRARPHRPRRDRRAAFHEGAAPLHALQQPLAPHHPGRPPSHGQMPDGVTSVVVQRMPLDHPAAGARMHLAWELDVGDQLAVVVDVGVGQSELGQGEQQLAPPLNRGGLGHAYGLVRSVASTPRASRPYVFSPSITERYTHHRGEDPSIPADNGT